MHLLLSGVIALLVPNIYETDPSLERFSLQAPQDPVEVGDTYAAYLARRADEPPMWWRALGWTQYIACATTSVSSEYRQDRSLWTPVVGNRVLRLGMLSGAALASNKTSERLRKNYEGPALAQRIAMIGLCSYWAGYNFNRGWFRE